MGPTNPDYPNEWNETKLPSSFIAMCGQNTRNSPSVKIQINGSISIEIDRKKRALTTALKRVDFPTLGRPTMPAFKLMLILQEDENLLRAREFPFLHWMEVTLQREGFR